MTHPTTITTHDHDPRPIMPDVDLPTAEYRAAMIRHRADLAAWHDRQDRAERERLERERAERAERERTPAGRAERAERAAAERAERAAWLDTVSVAALAQGKPLSRWDRLRRTLLADARRARLLAEHDRRQRERWHRDVVEPLNRDIEAERADIARACALAAWRACQHSPLDQITSAEDRLAVRKARAWAAIGWGDPDPVGPIAPESIAAATVRALWEREHCRDPHAGMTPDADAAPTTAVLWSAPVGLSTVGERAVAAPLAVDGVPTAAVGALLAVMGAPGWGAQREWLTAPVVTASRWCEQCGTLSPVNRPRRCDCWRDVLTDRAGRCLECGVRHRADRPPCVEPVPMVTGWAVTRGGTVRPRCRRCGELVMPGRGRPAEQCTACAAAAAAVVACAGCGEPVEQTGRGRPRTTHPSAECRAAARRDRRLTVTGPVHD